MKLNESDISSAREPHEAELSELAVRAVSDFARIANAEARLLESNLTTTAQALFDRVSVALLLIVLAGAGVVSILISIAMVLHYWMPWWQVLGLVGIGTIALAEGLRRALIARPAPAGPSPKTATESRP